MSTAAARATPAAPVVGAAGAAPAARGRPLAGTGRLLRLVLRRDRVRLVVWVVGLCALVVVSASSIEGLYPTPESLATYGALVRGNAAIIVQSGPGYGLERPTLGTVLVNETAIWMIVAVAVMSVLMVSRHTRAEEEHGRADLVRAAPVGRPAGAVAALLGVLLANVAVAVTVGLGLVAIGLPVAGSAAYGAALVGAGMTFAGVALVTAQVASGARGATGLALVVLAVSFVLRAVGDVGDGRLSWASPIGWAQAVRAYAGERWWVLALPAVATTALLGVAAALGGHRDVGAGMLPRRAGAERATRWLRSPTGLALRLQRASMLGWAAGLVVLGGFYGVVADQAEAMFEDNPQLESFLAMAGQGSVVDLFLATSVLMLGLLAAGAAVAGVLRIHGEEVAGRAEPVLATPTSRARWAGGHLVVVLAASALLLLAGGAATGAGAALTMGEPGRVAQLAGAALAALPAVAVLGAVAFLLVAALPRWSLLAWVGVAVAAVVGLFGEVLDLPGWARGLSPFHHTPTVPAEPVTAAPLVALAAVALGLAASGLALLRRRDLGHT